MYFLSCERVGDKIYERYIDDAGQEQERYVEYTPTLFHHAAPGMVTNYKDIYGKPCIAKKFPSMNEANKWRKKMGEMGQEALGMDDFIISYLSDTYKGEIRYDRNKIRVAWVDIEVTAPEFPKPEEAKYPIDAITHYDSVHDRFFVFDLKGKNGEIWEAKKSILRPDIVERVVYNVYDTEDELLLEYIRFFEENRPVGFTGWNTETFDIPYIIKRISNKFGSRTANRLSPCGKIKSRISQDDFGNEREAFTIMGIESLDYIDLYKKFSFTTQPTYALDYVAEYETGIGKVDYDGPLKKLRDDNHQLYIDYNIGDVDRVLAIDKKRGFIDLVYSLCFYAKIKFNHVYNPMKVWDAIIFGSLKAEGKVVPENKIQPKQTYPGAFVKEPVPNAYRWMMSFDLTSLYPSIIRQVNISPETIAGSFDAAPMHEYINKTAPRPSDEYSCSPNGWMYRKDIHGIVPIEIKKVFDQRKQYKNMMLACDRNAELCKAILHDENHVYGGTISYSVEVRHDFDEAFKSMLSELSKDALEKLLEECKDESILCNTNQLSRKVLINSLYGALGNPKFRFYDLRNASAITLFGQLAIQWIERKINEYLNELCGTTDFAYVRYCDTDSVYVLVNNVIDKVGGEDRFDDTEKLVDFLDNFGKHRMEPIIDKGYRELCEYMNNYEHLMFMDREAIAGPPLKSAGIGGFWTGKKRYALNVWDMEGTRFAEPKLKIMGLETQRSSTPKACQKSLKECIRRMLQEGEESLQEYYGIFEQEFRKLDYLDVAAVSSANNLQKYSDSNGYPIKGCPYAVKSVLCYNRNARKFGLDPIREGEKVMIVPLKDRNPFGEICFGWLSGTRIPPEIESEVLKWLDWPLLFNKTFVKPLENITTAAKLQYEKVASLTDLFDI